MSDTPTPLMLTEPPGPPKCAAPGGAGVDPLPCLEPGSLPRCRICPRSPTYWRRDLFPHLAAGHVA